MKNPWRNLHLCDTPEAMLATFATEHQPLVWPSGDGVLVEYSGVLDQPEWPTEQSIAAARYLSGRHPGGMVR